ncbi:PfkB family carbohydrate kinase [uncultured Microbacterium sp.]|uniref:PfkB family carbohydrate kinase n=1 Tax=uncultured Microbacterium sp. TaxID=191216 RepID=UPI002600A62E|nr:PfkB family carbohydrate kinase [uncultured Microbacterium sp.]
MKITVVGDVLLDADIGGHADRLSPDAPVPVVSIEATEQRPGGAGLVAALLAHDGAETKLVTALADDAHAAQLRRLLAAIDEASAGSLRVVAGLSPSPTPVKTRVHAGAHAVVRIDEACDLPGPPPVTAAMLTALDDADAVVVADYGRGLAADPVMRAALRRTADRVPVVWDPHPRGADPVPGVTVATPNLAEARTASGVSATGLTGAGDAADILVDRWRSRSVVVTLGERGALLRRRGSTDAVPHVVPAAPVASADPCGAGDRLAASLAVALADGASLPAALQAAVAAAGRFLASGGVRALTASPPVSSMSTGGDAEAVARAVRARGGTVVATGGCFDLLHAGHARTLAAARALGDCLVVCLNSDDSVRRLKGPERPIMTQDDRRDLLLALECVDAVAIFDESTPEAVLRRLTPAVWVKGGDYVAADLPETAVIAEWGGRTVTVPFHPGRSTTALAGALARVG